MNEGMSVLVVDDEPSMADLAAVHLERLHDDITVEVETGVADALARLERDPERIDCIVSDYTMPERDGLDFLTAVRESHSAVPFILFTGKGSEEIAGEAISAGVTDYLRKGTGTEQYALLANRIENAVEAYRAERRATELARINGVITDVQRELVRRTTREDIEKSVCARLADSAPYTLAWVGAPEAGAFVVRERAGTDTEYLDEVEIRADDTPRGRGPAGTALRTGEVQVTRNIPEQVEFAPWREAAGRHDHGSVIVLPLAYNGASYGVLAVYSKRRDAFDGDERAALAELGGTVAQAIHATETRAQLERREQALTESERKYRSLLDAAPDAVFVASDTGDIVEANAAAEELLGLPRAAIVGMHQSELHPEEDRERYRDLFEHGLATDRPSAAQFDDGSDVLVERADGETVPVEISAGIVEMNGKTLVHGRFRDVTDQRERERELREERAVTESLFEAMPDPVYAFDTDGRMRRWNDEFASVVAYTDEEILGMHCLEFLPTEDHDRIRERIETVVEGGESVTVESALVTKSGVSIPYEFSGARLVDGGVRGVIGVGRNVADRREREAAVAALHEATRDLVVAEDRTAVASAAVAAVEEILGFPIAVVRLHDPDADVLEPVAATDATTQRLGERPTYVRDEGFPWRAFRSGEPVVVGGEDAPTDGVPIRNRLYVPIGAHGTVTVASLDEAFSDTAVRLTRLLAANAAAALDRLRREERLRRYERMLDAAGDSVYALDTEGRFTAVNDRLVTVTGYTREELVGEHVSTVLAHEDVEHGESLVRGLLSQDAFEAESKSYEITVRTADGDTIPCEAQIALLGTAEFEGTVGVVRDITARKRHEELLESLHDATRGMMDAKTRTDVAEVAVATAERVLDLPVCGVWLAEDDALRPAAVSATGRELFETIPTYTATDESLAWEAFETGETRQYDRVDREANAYNPETPIRSELLVPLGEHGIVTIGSTESGKFDEREVSLAKLLGANTEAALNRAERERQLVIEHERLTALFENVPDAALRFEFEDGEPTFRSVNSRFETVFGHPAGEVVGESIDEFVVPPGCEAEASRFNEALLGGETVRTTVRRRTADGIRDFLLHVVPLDPGEHNTEGYAIYTDITDQKRRERDLERQNELLDEFASVISHDLRNPMSVVQGRLELAHDDCPSEHHEPAMRALSRMDALIEDVLTLARQGRVIGDTERVSLAAVAEQAWRTAGTETASLTTDAPGEIEADPDRLIRLFENLFRNATEHAGDGAEVVVGPLEGGFFVADDGPGIPADERERVFEHGYSTVESGTGLGLMIVRSIADAHGWDVRVTASEAGGARFEVRP